MRKHPIVFARRYRFQVMRLMYYSGQYARAQKYFEQYKDNFTEDDSPKYRFMDLAAGGYYKDKKYGKANYLFSLVFDKFLPLKRSHRSSGSAGASGLTSARGASNSAKDRFHPSWL